MVHRYALILDAESPSDVARLLRDAIGRHYDVYASTQPSFIGEVPVIVIRDKQTDAECLTLRLKGDGDDERRD